MAPSFVDNLDLLIEHLAGKTIDRHACLAEASVKAGAPRSFVQIPLQNTKSSKVREP